MKIPVSFVVAVLVELFATPTTAAEESGNFIAIASLSRDCTTFDRAGGTMIGGSLEGTSTVLESAGGPFSEGGHNLVTCAAYGKISAAGVDLEAPCTMTDAPGGGLYLLGKKSVGDVEEGGGKGRLELLGDTGRYADMNGICTYETEYLANDRLVTMMDCTWSEP